MKLLAVLILASPITLFADVIYFTNGKQVEGVVESDAGGFVTLRVPAGTMTIERHRIARIVPADSMLDEFNRRASELRRDCANCAGDWLSLALYAEQNGLTRQAFDAYTTVLQLDPGNTQARLALGYKYYNGVWLTQADYIRAAGLVRFNGTWVPREEAARLQALDAEARLKQAQANADSARAAADRAQSDVTRELKPISQPCAMPCSSTVLRNFDYY